MNILKTLENLMLAITLTLFSVWAIRELEYRLRPDGMKTQKRTVYSVDAIVRI
jgi:hypothetical protein